MSVSPASVRAADAPATSGSAVERCQNGQPGGAAHADPTGSRLRRSRLLPGEPLVAAEGAELGDVAWRDERDRPVEADAEAAAPGRHGGQVVAAGDEPGGEAGDGDAEHAADALELAEIDQQAETPVVEAVPLGLAERGGDIGGARLGLAEGVLGGRRGRPLRMCGVGPRGGVTEREDVVAAADGEVAVDQQAAAVVGGQADRAHQRLGRDPGGPDQGAGGELVAVGEADPVGPDLLDPGLQADLDAALAQDAQDDAAEVA